MIAIYLRVSTEKQDEEMQRSAIKRFIEFQQIDQPIVEFKDFGLSGTITERPGYQNLLTKVMSGNVTHVYVYEYSRIWRDLEEQNRALKVFAALNVCLMSVTEGAVTTIEDKFKANVLGAANVYEVERIQRRIKDGIRDKKEKIAKGLDTWNGRGPDKKLRKRRRYI